MAGVPDLAAALERQSFALDELIQDVRLRKTAGDFDGLEERAQQIASAIVASFRRPSAEQASARTAPGRNGGCWAW